MNRNDRVFDSNSRTETGFTAAQACKAVGISYRVLDYWDRTGVVSPSLGAANGSGSIRRYSYDDLARLSAAALLSRVGAARGRGTSGAWIAHALAHLSRPTPRDGLLIVGETAVTIAASLDEVVLDGATIILSFELVHDHLATTVPAVAVSSSPNLRTRGGGETGPARASHSSRPAPSWSGTTSSSADPHGCPAVGGEGDDLLEPVRGAAPGRTPEPANYCAP